MGSFMQTLSLASWILFCKYVPNLFLVTPTAQRVVKVKDQFSSLANNNDPIRLRDYVQTTVPHRPDPLSHNRSQFCQNPELLGGDCSRGAGIPCFSSWGSQSALVICKTWGEINFRDPQAAVSCLKTGLYQYVQHPSYTGFFPLQCAVNLFIGANTSGWFAGVQGDGKD